MGQRRPGGRQPDFMLHDGQLFGRTRAQTPAGLTPPRAWRRRKTELKHEGLLGRRRQSHREAGGGTRRVPPPYLDTHTHCASVLHEGASCHHTSKHHRWQQHSHVGAFKVLTPPTASTSRFLINTHTNRYWKWHGCLYQGVKHATPCWCSFGTDVNSLLTAQETRLLGEIRLEGNQRMSSHALQ